ncbi:MAG: PEP-CTERM sorting domain-containing protein, partial [Acidobacteriota bacterium]|nr:PEP-CTERM sorting domain-containing protein [Acidobacteriota bacterium]
ITDVGVPGDSFNVIVSGSINTPFSTPDVPIFSSLQVLNPDLAFGNPSFSWGRFALGPGSYTIDISLRTGSPGGGSGFVRAAAVPEPATLILLSTGVAGIVAGLRRRRPN